MKLLFTFLFLALLFSCTITKRHFGPGYHVEWKSSLSSRKSDPQPIVVDSNLIVEIKPAELSKIVQPDLNTMTNNKMEKPIPIDQNEQHTVDSKENQLIDSDEVMTSCEGDYISKNMEDQKGDEPETTPKKMQKNTWISLLFFLLLGIMTAIFSLTGFLMTVGAGVILFGLALGMFITSLIAVLRILKNPDRYKNRALSFTVFFFSCTFLFAGLVFFLAVGLSEINFF